MSKVYVDDYDYNLLNTVTKYGVFLWLGLFVLNVVLLLTDWYKGDNQIIVSLLSFLVQIAVLVSAITIARSSNYWRKLFVGLVVSFVGGLLVAISVFVFNPIIENSFYEEVQNRAEELFIEAEYDDDRIDQLLVAYGEPTIRVSYPASILVKTVFSGVIISIIVAAVIREKE